MNINIINITSLSNQYESHNHNDNHNHNGIGNYNQYHDDDGTPKL